MLLSLLLPSAKQEGHFIFELLITPPPSASCKRLCWSFCWSLCTVGTIISSHLDGLSYQYVFACCCKYSLRICTLFVAAGGNAFVWINKISRSIQYNKSPIYVNSQLLQSDAGYPAVFDYFEKICTKEKEVRKNCARSFGWWQTQSTELELHRSK